MTPKKNAEIEIVEKILKDHGIQMKVDGCGCCDSPWVKFKYGECDFDLDLVYIDTFDKEESE